MHRKLRIFTKKVKHKSEEASLVIKISFIIYATNFWLYVPRLKNLMKLEILYHTRRKIPFLEVIENHVLVITRNSDHFIQCKIYFVCKALAFVHVIFCITKA
jgi:hypothetical protein